MRPRTVHRSREFSCPQDVQRGLDQLIHLLEAGQDISPYMSTQVDRISFMDDMFNDWGVLHLHLGERLRPDGRLIERTGPILFLYLPEQTDDAYLINVYQHREWAKTSVLQTMYDNWPHLMNVLNGVQGTTITYSESQHQRLRQAGYKVLTQITDHNGNPIVVNAPGVGQVASRDSIIDVKSFGHMMNELRRMENEIRANLQPIDALYSGQPPKGIELKLIRDNGQYAIVDQQTGQIIFDVQ
ncbi:hypothetical protein D3C73_711300 [compost metagenome]